MSSSSSSASQQLALKYVLASKLKPTVIGSVPYALIDAYISASVTSKTHDYGDKQYYTATVNAALASEKAVTNSLRGLQLAPGFNFYADSLSSMVKEMITRTFEIRYPDLPLPKLEKYVEKGAFEELASLIFGKLLNELGKHHDRDSIEAMAKLAAAELLLQVYIKFFEDLGVIKVLS